MISSAISSDAIGKQSESGCADWLMAYAWPTMAAQTWRRKHGGGRVEAGRGKGETCIICTTAATAAVNGTRQTAKSAVHRDLLPQLIKLNCVLRVMTARREGGRMVDKVRRDACQCCLKQLLPRQANRLIMLNMPQICS